MKRWVLWTVAVSCLVALTAIAVVFRASIYLLIACLASLPLLAVVAAGHQDQPILSGLLGGGLAFVAVTVALVGLSLPNERLNDWCEQPGHYCENFLPMLFIWGTPFFILVTAVAAWLTRVVFNYTNRRRLERSAA